MDKILVAEDSFALANLLEFVLTNAGFEVNVNRSGDAACKTAMAEEFDLLLLDQQMPGMLGTEVLETIRRAGPNQMKPAFLCTAKTHELDLEDLREMLQVTDVFHKPFSPKDLVARLKKELQPTPCAESV